MRLPRSAERWISAGVLLYAFALVFRRLFYLPVVAAKVQPPEWIFLFLGPLALVVLGRRLWPGVSWLLGGLLLYLGALTVSALRVGETGTLLEALGRWYLLLLFFLVGWYVRTGGRRGVERLLWAWTWGCVVMFLVAYVGYGLALAGVSYRWVSVYENYPYFGTVIRAGSVAGGATPVAVLGMLPLAWHWRRWRTGRGGAWFLVLAAPILFLTYAKEVLLVGLACAIADPLLERRRWLAVVLAIGVAGIYWGSTHYLVEPVHDYTEGELTGVVYNSGNVVVRTPTFQLTETSYTSIKRGCLAAFRANPLLGIGPDQLEHFMPTAKAEGVYPVHLPNYTPHSTYFGAIAETGLLGTLGLGLFLVSCVRAYRRAVHLPEAARLALAGFGVAFLIGGLCMDLMHLRFIWVGVGVLLGGMELRKTPV